MKRRVTFGKGCVKIYQTGDRSCGLGFEGQFTTEGWF